MVENIKSFTRLWLLRMLYNTKLNDILYTPFWMTIQSYGITFIAIQEIDYFFCFEFHLSVVKKMDDVVVGLGSM